MAFFIILVPEMVLCCCKDDKAGCFGRRAALTCSDQYLFELGPEQFMASQPKRFFENPRYSLKRCGQCDNVDVVRERGVIYIWRNLQHDAQGPVACCQNIFPGLYFIFPHPHMWAQAVTHPSTNMVTCCLTSVIRQDLVLSTWYDHIHLT